MSGATTLTLNGGTDTLDFGGYTDPSGGHIPGPFVLNDSPGNQALVISVSWAYVVDSATLTIDSLLINRFTRGDILDYRPAAGTTSVDGEQEFLQSLAPNGHATELGVFSVDGFAVVGFAIPALATEGDQVQTAGGIDIGTTQPCCCAGTRIRTATGEVAIEGLRAGDKVVTARSRGAEPVVWVGRRTVECALHPRRWEALPVRVQAHALGRELPGRDLWLSPDHAIFVDGVLIPIRYLINGASVAQQQVGRVTYYHLELARHDVVLAEGLPAESLLDTGNRAAFASCGRVVEVVPDVAPDASPDRRLQFS